MLRHCRAELSLIRCLSGDRCDLQFFLFRGLGFQNSSTELKAIDAFDANPRG